MALPSDEEEHDNEFLENIDMSIEQCEQQVQADRQHQYDEDILSSKSIRTVLDNAGLCVTLEK